MHLSIAALSCINLIMHAQCFWLMCSVDITLVSEFTDPMVDTCPMEVVAYVTELPGLGFRDQLIQIIATDRGTLVNTAGI